MKTELLKFYELLQQRGLTPEQERKILLELEDDRTHEQLAPELPQGEFLPDPLSVYDYYDLIDLQGMPDSYAPYTTCLRSLDELLERDKLREKDGFPRKIRVGRLIKPGKGGKDKIVVVPTTVEEKFMHDSIRSPEEEGTSGGSGEGEEGEVIGEQPVREENAPGSGPGQGEGDQHEMESSAYDLGKILTEKFELPKSPG